MIIPLRPARRALHMRRLRHRLVKELLEKESPGRLVFDMEIAVGAGVHAMERGTPFFEAVKIAEDMLKMIDAGMQDGANSDAVGAVTTHETTNGDRA